MKLERTVKHEKRHERNLDSIVCVQIKRKEYVLKATIPLTIVDNILLSRGQHLKP